MEGESEYGGEEGGWVKREFFMSENGPHTLKAQQQMKRQNSHISPSSASQSPHPPTPTSTRDQAQRYYNIPDSLLHWTENHRSAKPTMMMTRLVLAMVALLLLLLSQQQPCTVQGRALRFTASDSDEQQGWNSDDSVKIPSSSAASSNDHASNIMRSLAFRLASGPSKKGSGH